jgi:hypothetical protein
MASLSLLSKDGIFVFVIKRWHLCLCFQNMASLSLFFFLKSWHVFVFFPLFCLKNHALTRRLAYAQKKVALKYRKLPSVREMFRAKETPFPVGRKLWYRDAM